MVRIQYSVDPVMAVLKQISGSGVVPEHFVGTETTTIGRLKDCDVTIESPAVSRRHFQIVCDDSHYFIEDLNSRNGTLLNDKILRAKTLLCDGDRIEISSLHFLFLTRDSLSELSGSWGVGADVIRVSKTLNSGDDSVRRQHVEYGDVISANELGTDPFQNSQVLARITVSDSGAAWPVVNSPTEKLNYTLRLLSSLRKTNRTEDVIGRCLQSLFDTFPSAERISLVLRDESGNGVRVIAAVSRPPGQVVEICLPVVRSTMQTCDAVLFLDHSKKTSSLIPELEAPSIRFIMAAPLTRLLGRSFGVIQIDTDNNKQPLTNEDLELLVILMHVMSSAVEQSQEVEERISKTMTEHGSAGLAQLRSLTEAKSPPTVSGYRFSRHRVGPRRNAGDFIDYLTLPDGRTACLFVDLTQRNANANATNVVAVVFRLLAEAVCTADSAEAAMTVTHEWLQYRKADVAQNISVALMILDPRNSSVEVCIAGSFSLFRVRRKVVSQIDCSDKVGPPLLHTEATGESPGKKNQEDVSPVVNPNECVSEQLEGYGQITVNLIEDDRLMVFTDGLLKLESPEGMLMNADRLTELATESSSGSEHFFEARLKERIVQQSGDMAVQNSIAFATIQKTSTAGERNLATTITTAREQFNDGRTEAEIEIE